MRTGLQVFRRETSETCNGTSPRLADGESAAPTGRERNPRTKLTMKSRERVESRTSALPASPKPRPPGGRSRAVGRGRAWRLRADRRPPPPAPGLTARRTRRRTCALRTTTRPPVTPRRAAAGAERERRERGRRGRAGRAAGAGARPVGAPRGRAGRLHGPPAASRPGPPPPPPPGCPLPGRARPGPPAAARGPRGGGAGSRAPAGREGAAAAPQPEAWRRAAGGGAGRGGACSGHRPREAARRVPERLSLGLDGRGRPGAAPRLLTGGEERRVKSYETMEHVCRLTRHPPSLSHPAPLGEVLSLLLLASCTEGLTSPSPVLLHLCPQWWDPGHGCREGGGWTCSVCVSRDRAKQWPSQCQAGSTRSHSAGNLAVV
ncbi:uncharacterized protein [Tursiops truncatus]|uniref:uncharacterized protein n=1 Tax=Tursiops truncatus TaxID=9739 RepID=UPI003CCF1BBA